MLCKTIHDSEKGSIRRECDGYRQVRTAVQRAPLHYSGCAGALSRRAENLPASISGGAHTRGPSSWLCCAAPKAIERCGRGRCKGPCLGTGRTHNESTYALSEADFTGGPCTVPRAGGRAAAGVMERPGGRALPGVPAQVLEADERADRAPSHVRTDRRLRE